VTAQSIVCGVDPSPGARSAARFAGLLAERLSLSLVLVYAVSPPVSQRELGLPAPGADWQVLEELRRAGADLLEELTQELAPTQALRQLEIGDARNSIAAAAEHIGAELVVVGSRGLGPVGTLVLGSVSHWLAVHGPCPTVIVPEAGGTLTGQSILCAVDDSDEARAAVRTAASLAERLDVPLVLLHVQSGDGAEHGEELLARLVAESGVGASAARLVLDGEAAKLIAEVATTRGSELVVMGSRGRGALAAAALGSVSSAVATHAPCPVVIVRAEAERPGASIAGA
jgi:nucleotide-binding universal stress UspA family protein